MGVNLRELIPIEPIEMKDLAGKRVGIDAYNWTYQFLSTILVWTGEKQGEPLKDSKGRITSHISGLFNRTANMLKENILPCYVWDGKPPALKARTIELRKKRKEEAAYKLKHAKTEEEARKYAQQTAHLTHDMIADAEALLSAMGVPSVHAPSEGEAQIAHMVFKNDFWTCASQDWDSLVFGSKRLVRNLSVTGKKKLPGKLGFKTVKPELIELSKALKALDINQEQLITMAMLIGTDYCPGVLGYGPKKSLAIVKEHNTLKQVLEHVKWDFDVPAEKIFELFKTPETTDSYTLEWNPIDKEKIIQIMVDKHDFSLERVDSQLKQIEETNKQKKQTGLSKFF